MYTFLYLGFVRMLGWSFCQLWVMLFQPLRKPEPGQGVVMHVQKETEP